MIIEIELSGVVWLETENYPVPVQELIFTIETPFTFKTEIYFLHLN